VASQQRRKLPELTMPVRGSQMDRYAEYRNRQLVPISAGCGLLTVGYLATASVIAPMFGHVLMHTAAILYGAELPPLTRSVMIPAPRLRFS
jgi:hypothetical protein